MEKPKDTLMQLVGDDSHEQTMLTHATMPPA